MKRFDKFSDTITNIVLDNLSNEQFGVESLAEIYGISRSQLFKKIKRATGKSASQFIRDIRLEEAFNRLKKENVTISQVAHDVGFSSHAYFATCFKDFYGYAPSAVKGNKATLLDSIEPNTERRAILKKNWIKASLVALIAILLGIFIVSYINTTKIDKEKTVAVIRFENMTDDDDNQIFADGLGEEIINSLCKIHELKVTARNSSFQFSKEDDVTKISKALGINYVLEGSIRKENNLYRITIQLIDASDGYHLWSETYDRAHKDVLSLQEEISRIVAHELEVRLTEKEEIAMSSRITQDSLAYNLFNESIKTAASNKIGDVKKGVALMNKAIEVDSNFAMAHARIVSLYRRDNFAGETEIKHAIERMQTHIDKAIRLNPSLGENYIAKGHLEVLKEDYTAALKALTKAVEMAPNEPRAHFALSYVLRYFNRKKEGYNAWIKAFELDPLNPQISLMVAQFFYYNKKDFEKGIRVLRNSIEAYPDNDLAACHLEMYRASLPKGDLVGAFKNYFEMYKKNPDDRRNLNWLFCAATWLDLKPVSEVLNNKMRLQYPTNIHTFWNMYTSNALNGRFTENKDLVEFWYRDQKLNLIDKVNYMAESYINNNNPELARQIILEAFPAINTHGFLNNAEHFDPQKSSRLDVIEKYTITLRELGDQPAVDKIVTIVDAYINNDLESLSKDNILDYRYELNSKLMRASINDNVDEAIAILEKVFFEDKHRIWMHDKLVTFARYHRFKRNPKFVSFLERVTKETHVQRKEAITFLKQEGFWETTWNSNL